MDPIASPEPERSTERREIVVSYSCLNMRGNKISRETICHNVARYVPFIDIPSIIIQRKSIREFPPILIIVIIAAIIKFINKIIFKGMSKKQAIRLPNISFEI